MRFRTWNLVLVMGALSGGACGGSASGDGNGDGDALGDGDVSGDGDASGDGDGDTSGDGDGDTSGDGDGDTSGDGDAPGSGGGAGDGDGDTPGDGDRGGDGDVVACTAEYVYGLNVRVVGGVAPVPQPFIAPPGDGDVGDLIPPPSGGAGNVGTECMATVVAVDGDHMETLMCSEAFDNSGDCMCQGAGERAGTYEVTVTLNGQTQTRTAEVTADICHVHPVELTFFGPR